MTFNVIETVISQPSDAETHGYDIFVYLHLFPPLVGAILLGGPQTIDSIVTSRRLPLFPTSTPFYPTSVLKPQYFSQIVSHMYTKIG